MLAELSFPHAIHAMTFASLRLFTSLVYVSTYCVPIAHLRQNKPFPLLYLGHAQITRIQRGKAQVQEGGSHAVKDQKQIRTSSWLIN